MSEAEKTVDDESTDEALSLAWDEEVKGVSEEKKAAPEAKKEVPVETKPEVKEETPPEPTASEKTPEQLALEEKHREESKLGRKVKGLEARLEQVLAKLEAAPPRAETVIEEPEVVTTPEDVRNVLKADAERQQRSNLQYEVSYMKQVQQLKSGEDDEEFYDEIVAELTGKDSPFNVRHTDNAFADARVNFAEAKVAVLQRKYAEKTKSPVPNRDRAEVTPVGPAAAASREVVKASVLPKLDKAAQDYVNYLREQNVPEEEIIAALQ